jgi:hypothetical protein
VIYFHATNYYRRETEDGKHIQANTQKYIGETIITPFLQEEAAEWNWGL